MTITEMEIENTVTINGIRAVDAAPNKKNTFLSHRTYKEMIKDAIVTLKKRTGSSKYEIQKFIEEKKCKELPPTFRELLLHNLERLVTSGELVKVRASFKLPRAKPSSPKAVVTSSPKAVVTSSPKAVVTSSPKAVVTSSVPQLSYASSLFMPDEIREQLLKEADIDENEYHRVSWGTSIDRKTPKAVVTSSPKAVLTSFVPKMSYSSSLCMPVEIREQIQGIDAPQKDMNLEQPKVMPEKERITSDRLAEELKQLYFRPPKYKVKCFEWDEPGNRLIVTVIREPETKRKKWPAGIPRNRVP